MDTIEASLNDIVLRRYKNKLYLKVKTGWKEITKKRKVDFLISLFLGNNCIRITKKPDSIVGKY